MELTSITPAAAENMNGEKKLVLHGNLFFVQLNVAKELNQIAKVDDEGEKKIVTPAAENVNGEEEKNVSNLFFVLLNVAKNYIDLEFFELQELNQLLYLNLAKQYIKQSNDVELSALGLEVALDHGGSDQGPKTGGVTATDGGNRDGKKGNRDGKKEAGRDRKRKGRDDSKGEGGKGGAGKDGDDGDREGVSISNKYALSGTMTG
ncbi:uncharacterized protein LOC130745006 [Lotus japonicus]|uniref:uncharacterized protein LOC130745006 n=1 Tax=Lotus japonicus TaxID=34305 RepID=UPI002588B442|nr:uncharacterized protein LOC130745006 [Lotus japonicus]